jgi:ATP-dependent DNA helicase PIF1
MLHDICNDDKPFGGLIVVFGGNFCQILSVIIKGYKGKNVVASLRKSLLWDGIRILRLQQHMHLAKTS